MPYSKSSTQYIDTRLSLRTPSSYNPAYSGIPSFPLVSSRTGSESKNFRALIAAQVNATTDLSASRETGKVSIGSFTLRHKPGYESPVSGSCMTPSLTSTGLAVTQAMKDGAKADAIKYFNNQILKYRSPFNGQIFLGELRETIRFLRNPLETSLRLGHAFEKKLAKAKRSGLTSAVSDTWLEFRFAILPLLSDTFTILNTIEKVALEKDVIRITSYGERNTLSSSSDVVQPVSSTYFWYLKDVEQKAQCFIKAGLLLAKLDTARKGIDKLKDSMLDFELLPSTLWELTPFSFLVDYFFNIGDIVGTPLSGYDALSYYSLSEVQSVKVSVRYSHHQVANPSVFSSLEIASPTSWVYEKRQVQRTGVASAIPPITFSLPGSSIQYLNIAALIAKFNKL
jgi:hypothetical protein